VKIWFQNLPFKFNLQRYSADFVSILIANLAGSAPAEDRIGTKKYGSSGSGGGRASLSSLSNSLQSFPILSSLVGMLPTSPLRRTRQAGVLAEHGDYDYEREASVSGRLRRRGGEGSVRGGVGARGGGGNEGEGEDSSDDGYLGGGGETFRFLREEVPILGGIPDEYLRYMVGLYKLNPSLSVALRAPGFHLEPET
jgi:hypothetical protein